MGKVVPEIEYIINVRTGEPGEVFHPENFPDYKMAYEKGNTRRYANARGELLYTETISRDSVDYKTEAVHNEKEGGKDYYKEENHTNEAAPAYEKQERGREQKTPQFRDRRPWALAVAIIVLIAAFLTVVIVMNKSENGENKNGKSENKTEMAPHYKEIPTIQENVYIAENCEVLEFSGNSIENQTDEYTITADEDGFYSFELEQENSNKIFNVKCHMNSNVQKKSRIEEEHAFLITKEMYKGDICEITVEDGLVVLGEEVGSYTVKVYKPKPAIDISEYTAVRDSLEYIGQRNVYTFVPNSSGTQHFTIDGMQSGMYVCCEIYNEDGQRIYDPMNLSSGETISLDNLEKGKQYTIVVSARETLFDDGELGDYTLNLKLKRDAIDFTGFDGFEDRFVYEDQINKYRFMPENSGDYRLSIEKMEEGIGSSLGVYDDYNHPIEEAYVDTEGDTMTIEMESGQEYTIQMIQEKGLGRYTVKIEYLE